MTETEHIDSTNLGLLARIARYGAAHSGRQPVINTNREDIVLLLETMGFDRVFRVCDEPSEPSECLKEIPEVDESGGLQARTILDAHRALMNMNDGNRARFRDVVEMMGREVDSGRDVEHGIEARPPMDDSNGEANR